MIPPKENLLFMFLLLEAVNFELHNSSNTREEVRKFICEGLNIMDMNVEGEKPPQIYSRCDCD